jgi:dihydroxyacetone kinase-like predicted kinase
MMDLSADTVEELIEGMTEYLPGVTTCSVTTATRDTVMNGVEVKMGKYIGLDGDSILCCEDTALEALIAMLKNLPDIEEKQVITMFYGSDVSDEELEKAQDLISENYPLIDFGCVYGGQNVYNYILSVE